MFHSSKVRVSVSTHGAFGSAKDDPQMTAQFPPHTTCNAPPELRHAPRALHPKYHHVGMLPPQRPHLPRHPKPRTKNSASNHGTAPPQPELWPHSNPKDPRLTAGAVRPSPVAGVRGNAAAVHTLLCTQGCGRSEEREEEQDQCENQAIWSRSTIHFVKMLRMHLWLQGKASYS